MDSYFELIKSDVRRPQIMTANAIFLIVFLSAVAVILGGTVIFAFVKFLAWRGDPQAFEENLRGEMKNDAEREQKIKAAERERIRLGKASPLGIFFGFLMLAFAFVVLYMAVRGGYDLARTQTWEKSDCTVLEIGADRRTSTKSATTYYPKIVYEYEFSGVKYTGNRFDAVNKSYDSDEIGDALKFFPRGASFTCFVNPRQPQESVASRNVWQYPIFRFSFGLLIGFGFAALLLYNSLPRRKKL